MDFLDSFGRGRPYHSRFRNWIVPTLLGSVAVFSVLVENQYKGCPFPPGIVYLRVDGELLGLKRFAKAEAMLECLYADFDFHVARSDDPHRGSRVVDVLMDRRLLLYAADTGATAGSRVIRVNPNHSEFGYRTLAHEFGHQVLGHICVERWWQPLDLFQNAIFDFQIDFPQWARIYARQRCRQR
jgi:hypothetical protein